MLALVVVIDLGKAVDRFRNVAQSFGGHGHRRQGAGTDAFWREDCANARNLSFAPQGLQHAQNRYFGNAEPGCQFAKGRRAERKVPLKVVKQSKIEGVVLHFNQNPIRLARVVKKMPLGLLAANSPIPENIVVS